MEETANLSLPYIMPSQAQKHVTHNEALRMLDALVHLSALDDGLTEAPADPAEGDRHIVGAGATDAWAGHDGEIAAWQDGGWQFFTPRRGWICHVASGVGLLVHSGTAWEPLGGAIGSLQDIPQLGIGTSANGANPFSAKLNNVLWSARHGDEAGTGDLRMVMNKEAPSGVLSLLMQSNWSGRAEIGLAGDDDLTIRTSADGASWHDALKVDGASGAIAFPAGIVHPASGIEAPLYVPAPAADIWRLDASRTAMPRSYAVGSVSGTTLTLTSAIAGEIFGTNMRGHAAVRVWNVSKSPAQSAWVDWNESATALRVTDADDIAGWANGETIRLGDPDPTGDNTLEMVAVDISAYLLAVFGTVFRQKGVFVSLYVSSSDGAASLDLSATGAAGSAVGGNALSNGVRNQMAVPVPTSVQSPISDSNLLFIREAAGGGASDLTLSFARVLGIYV